MADEIYTRVIKYANYIVENKATIRECAKTFGNSKSSVHLDLKKRLPIYNFQLYKEVRNILEQNFLEKHLRGGEAMRIKCLKEKMQIE